MQASGPQNESRTLAKHALLLVGGGVVIGVVAGLALWGALWLMQDWLQDPESWQRRQYGRHKNPLALIAFVAGGLGLGVVTSAPARLLGGRNLLLAVPTGIAVICALLICHVLCQATIDPWTPAMQRGYLYTIGVTVLVAAAGLWKQWKRA